MESDAFKFKNFNHLPNSTDEIKPSKKGISYAVSMDTANDLVDSFYQYAVGYYNAAEAIANRMLVECKIDELDNYFFPLFFLYRHSLELLLKSIGCVTYSQKCDRITFIRDTFHNPGNILRNISQHTSVLRPKAEMEWLEKYFDSISAFDEASDSFRYPFRVQQSYDRFGMAQYSISRVFPKQTHIDLIGEIHKMKAAYEILDAWHSDFMDSGNEHIASEYLACGTNFLEEGGHYYAQSVVGYEYSHNDFYSYCSGYQECGNFLKQYMIEEWDAGNQQLSQYMIYPMCYLYRNNIELTLKAIIIECSGESIHDNCKMTYENKHRICALFRIIENNIIPMYSLNAQDPYIQNAKRYCEILHKFDLDSSRFRYPVNKHCDPYIGTRRYFSFHDLGIFLESLCNAVDGIYCEISYRQEMLAEMAAEYSGYE